MRDHHAKALEKATARLLALETGTLAIILGGSIAKGIDREESDVDLIVVLPDERYAERLKENNVSFLWYDIPGYEGGLVEGRFVSRSFIREAAARGSEPTRFSFIRACPVYCIDAEIPDILPRIPVYPENSRSKNLTAFFSQLQCNRAFFWDQGKRNRYLQIRAASDIVHFGCRLILAHNRLLYPGQRRLIEVTLAAPGKPDQFEQKMNAFLVQLTDETKEDFCMMMEKIADWGKDDRYILDVEMSWFNQVHAVAEW
ncbi:MAG TPA: nucleotidyltransferase domain-containing protein [Candidatus Methylacidiphilales bacterium]|jgi:hypothetical protein|nr:nucleotidyltransferase domain-containing protein [Candidatus Methylacidiphilales bacterium]